MAEDALAGRLEPAHGAAAGDAVDRQRDRAAARKRWFGRGFNLATEQNRNKPNPTFIAAGNTAAAWLAEHTDGIAQSNVLEALGNIPTTAHLLGGAVIGADATRGVIDTNLRVFGYRNLLVCDGAAMPANPGVNPSLTITALAEHAMAHLPAAARMQPGAVPAQARIQGERPLIDTARTPDKKYRRP